MQIDLTAPTTKSAKKGSEEPRIELIPRTGNYIVEFGKLEQVEEKMYRWRRFVESKVVDLEGGKLNVEFEGQALWRAPKQTKTTKK